MSQEPGLINENFHLQKPVSPIKKIKQGFFFSKTKYKEKCKEVLLPDSM